MEPEYDLTSDEQNCIRENCSKVSDINELAKIVFKDEKEKASTRKGQAMRVYIVKNKLHYPSNGVNYQELLQEQKRIIEESLKEDMTVYDIAKKTFPDREIKKLCKEFKQIAEYIKQYYPDYTFNSYANAKRVTFTPEGAPKQTSGLKKLINKINSVCGIKLSEETLTNAQKIALEKVSIYMDSLRFASVMDGYEEIQDKELFEQEFIKHVWGKNDLTHDDTNLYINVCKEIVNSEQTSRELTKLRKMFNKIDEQSDIQMRLSEMISTKNKEYNDSMKRMEDLIKKLSGSREERQKKKREENKNILTIIQAFQEDEERRRMLDMADKQRKLVQQEVERIETMVEWKARILGVSQDEVV